VGYPGLADSGTNNQLEEQGKAHEKLHWETSSHTTIPEGKSQTKPYNQIIISPFRHYGLSIDGCLGGKTTGQNGQRISFDGIIPNFTFG
jgi:hypothetical protein